MRLNKRLQACVAFARFCQEYRIDPPDLAELLMLAERAFVQGERYCNNPENEAACDQAYQAFESVAKRLGFVAYWPGLWPALRDRDGREVYLPVVD